MGNQQKGAERRVLLGLVTLVIVPKGTAARKL